MSPIVILASIVAIGGGTAVAVSILRHDPIIEEHFGGGDDFSFGTSGGAASGAAAGGAARGGAPAGAPGGEVIEGRGIDFDPRLVEEARAESEKKKDD